MTTHAEDVLYASLTDADALEELARTGLDLECVPTEAMREVVAWAVEYFHHTGRTQAPSKEMVTEEWGKRLEECDITLPEEDVQVDDVSWAIGMLKSQWVLVQSQVLQRDIAVNLAQAVPGERVHVLTEAAEEFHQLALRVRDRSQEQEGTQGLTQALERYRQRQAAGNAISGMALGMEGIDAHTLGIHDGEIAAWAAPPKGSKSWTASSVAIGEWRRGRPTVLYTLENSVSMTYDRIACQICAVDYRAFQQGRASEEDVQRIVDFLARHGDDLREGLHVISPGEGGRTPGALVRHTQILGAKSLVIDQLSHIQHPAPNGRRPRNEVVRDIMQELSILISTGRHTLPAFLTCQINREGERAAAKAGKLELSHLAESSEIERSSSWVFGLMRSEAEVIAGVATVQTLASRRMDLRHWQCAWEPWYGIQKTLREVQLQ